MGQVTLSASIWERVFFPAASEPVPEAVDAEESSWWDTLASGRAIGVGIFRVLRVLRDALRFVVSCSFVGRRGIMMVRGVPGEGGGWELFLGRKLSEESRARPVGER